MTTEGKHPQRGPELDPTREGRSAKLTKTEQLWRSIKNHTPVAVLSVIFGVIIGTGNVADAISHVLSFVHPAPTPLMLAQENAKSEFSRRLTQDAWERMFWMRSYIARTKRGASSVDLDNAWNKYVESTAQWNRNLMVSYQALEEYYPHSGKGAIFLSEIQPQFNILGEQLADLRYSKSPEHQKLDKSIETDIDKLNHALFEFVTTHNEGELKNPT